VNRAPFSLTSFAARTCCSARNCIDTVSPLYGRADQSLNGRAKRT
jgi:hypothetical protein